MRQCPDTEAVPQIRTESSLTVWQEREGLVRRVGSGTGGDLGWVAEATYPVVLQKELRSATGDTILELAWKPSSLGTLGGMM